MTIRKGKTMPMDKSRYPADWKAISLRIREREGWRCKWCGVKNGAIGYREKDGAFVQLAACEADVGMETEAASLDGERVIKIVLTVAHINHDTTDNSDGNLAALCQRCHIRHDAKLHAGNAARTRRAHKIEAGQTELSL